jgi:hypothetical protein
LPSPSFWFIFSDTTSFRNGVIVFGKQVRPYPRRAFSIQDGALTFEELSLTNKQEALFLELLV